MQPQQDYDIDIHLPTGNEQLPNQMFRRFDNLLKSVNPVVVTVAGIVAFNIFQSLGALIKTYFLTRVMWWAVMLTAIAVVLGFLLPKKFRLFYFVGIVFAIVAGAL